VPRFLTAPLVLFTVLNVPDPTGAAGCGTSYTQVVFGNPQILGL
jgi:hypothetical protein